ncbi:hypothetical protein [Phytoactinopolyspora halophila]|uniref:hypothetical protein n=1 Tax=Phytoactinopolyspora halophila TaxID=1981511 RepID=UPI000F4F31D2|nr:hypothetical protein [Phytoactinopolyspora halophila]
MNAGQRDMVLTIGTLRLSVVYAGMVSDESGGRRCQYRYMVESTDPEAPGAYSNDDLFAGVGDPVDAERAMRALSSYLSAAGEAFGLRFAYPGREFENKRMFPEWVDEAAYQNAEELATLALNDEELIPDETTPPHHERYISVVFHQGDDAEETLRILDEQGLQAALEHLARWDFGDETEYAAEANGYVYDAPPTGDADREYTDGEYVMSYSHAFGHVGLVRKVEKPASGVDMPETTLQQRSPRRSSSDRSAWTTPAEPHLPPGLEPPGR